MDNFFSVFDVEAGDILITSRGAWYMVFKFDGELLICVNTCYPADLCVFANKGKDDSIDPDINDYYCVSNEEVYIEKIYRIPNGNYRSYEIMFRDGDFNESKNGAELIWQHLEPKDLVAVTFNKQPKKYYFKAPYKSGLKRGDRVWVDSAGPDCTAIVEEVYSVETTSEYKSWLNRFFIHDELKKVLGKIEEF